DGFFAELGDDGREGAAHRIPGVPDDRGAVLRGDHSAVGGDRGPADAPRDAHHGGTDGDRVRDGDRAVVRLRHGVRGAGVFVSRVRGGWVYLRAVGDLAGRVVSDGGPVYGRL